MDVGNGYSFEYPSLNTALGARLVCVMIGCVSVTVNIAYTALTSNSVNIKLYKKNYGSTSWALYHNISIEPTVFNINTWSAIYSEFALWVMIVTPNRVALTTTATVNGFYSSFISYNGDHAIDNTGKKLRICNNSVRVKSTEFPWNETDSSILSNSWTDVPISTSVGTLFENGQWIFGQN